MNFHMQHMPCCICDDMTLSSLNLFSPINPLVIGIACGFNTLRINQTITRCFVPVCGGSSQPAPASSFPSFHAKHRLVIWKIFRQLYSLTSCLYDIKYSGCVDCTSDSFHSSLYQSVLLLTPIARRLYRLDIPSLPPF